jgi:hypothetical protein
MAGEPIIHSISTLYPQWYGYLLTGTAILASVIALALYLHLRHCFRRDFPGKDTINGLKKEVSEFSGDVADLTERFARFQKREGMRSARDEKDRARTLQQQAQEIAADTASGAVPASGDPADIKAALRRQIRSAH